MTHESFTITRDIAAAPEVVFECWADPAKKRAWFVDTDGPGWETRTYSSDFRVGGRETGTFELTEGPGAGRHENQTVYLAIFPGRQIDFAYTMALDGRVHSASLATVTLEAKGDGTKVIYTESLSPIGETDGAAGRQNGWGSLLQHLKTYAEREKVDG